MILRAWAAAVGVRNYLGMAVMTVGSTGGHSHSSVGQGRDDMLALADHPDVSHR